MRYDVIRTCNMILLNVWKSPLTNSRDSELVPWTQIRRWRLRDARMRDRGAQHLAKILQDVEPPTPIRLECLRVWMVEVFLSRLQSLQLSRSTNPISFSCSWFVQFDIMADTTLFITRGSLFINEPGSYNINILKPFSPGVKPCSLRQEVEALDLTKNEIGFPGRCRRCMSQLCQLYLISKKQQINKIFLSSAFRNLDSKAPKRFLICFAPCSQRFTEELAAWDMLWKTGPSNNSGAWISLKLGRSTPVTLVQLVQLV